MPVPSAITDLSQTAGSNSPPGSESPTTTDDYLRAHASFIALLRDGKGLSAEADVASAATCDIGGANTPFVRITGTTTITSFGTSYNGPRFIRFAGALTLTHNSSTLILPDGASITTAAGDTCVVSPIGSPGSGWQVLAYQSVGDETDVASAGTTDIGASATPLIRITGTTTITSFGAKYRGPRFIRFADALTLTHNASSLILPGGANIVTAAGDTCVAIPISAGWVVYGYQRALGNPGTVITGTATSLSGASVDFTSIPSWVTNIEVTIAGLTTNGTSVPILQIGDGGGIEATNYNGTVGAIAGASTNSAQLSSGFALGTSNDAGATFHGKLSLSLLDAATNTWTCSGNLGKSNTAVIYHVGGSKALSAVLTQFRLTTEGGVNTFDGGTANYTAW